MREGRYPLWGPLHYLSRASAGDSVKTVIGYLSGTKSFDKLDLLSSYFQARVVPLCAMNVQRSIDGGPVSAFSSPSPCSCRHDELAGSTSCNPCSSGCSTDEVCSYGFCERP